MATTRNGETGLNAVQRAEVVYEYEQGLASFRHYSTVERTAVNLVQLKHRDVTHTRAVSFYAIN